MELFFPPVGRRLFRSCALVAIVILALAGCSPGGQGTGSESHPGAAATQKLSILETTPGFFDVPIYGMMNDGFAQQNGLTLEKAEFFSGSGSSSQIFAGGSGDILFAGLNAPAELMQSKALDVSVFGTLMQRGVFKLVSKRGSDIRTLQDLKGKTVGISGPGSFNDAALRDALKKGGVNPDEVKIAALGGTPQQYAALIGGHADAVQLQSPMLEIATANGEIQDVFDFRQEITPGLVFVARTERIKQDPAPYKSFIRAYAQVIQKMQNDPTYARDLAKRAWGNSSPEDIDTQLKVYLSDPGIWAIDGKFTQQQYDNGRNTLVNSGLFKSDGFPSFADLTAASPTNK